MKKKMITDNLSKNGVRVVARHVPIQEIIDYLNQLLERGEAHVDIFFIVGDGWSGFRRRISSWFGRCVYPRRVEETLMEISPSTGNPGWERIYFDVVT